MSDFVIQKKKMNIVIGENKYPVSKPSLVEIQDMVEQEENCKSDRDKIELVKQLLVKQGLPIEVVNSFDIDEYTAVVELFLGKKKD
jgi:hypothetical protein